MLKNRSIFFSVFPPPALLDMPYAGIDITDDAIRAVVLVAKNGTYEVARFAERLLPKGLVDAGYISNENALAQELKALKETLNLSLVRVSLPEEKMYLFKVDTGNVADEALRSLVETKLEENIPIPPTKAIFEVDPFDHKAMVFAFPQKVVHIYLSCCTLAGLTVKAFDTQPRAIIRALRPSSTSIIVNISERKTGIYVVDGGVARFSSTIPFGGERITDAISKALAVTPEIARTTKFDELFIEGDRTKEIFNTALNTMSVIKDEIYKVVTYWNTHGEGNKVTKIYIVGHDAQIAGYVEYLESNLKVPVIIGDIWASIMDHDGSIPPIEFGKALDYAVALGLTIPER